MLPFRATDFFEAILYTGGSEAGRNFDKPPHGDCIGIFYIYIYMYMCVFRVTQQIVIFKSQGVCRMSPCISLGPWRPPAQKDMQLFAFCSPLFRLAAFHAQKRGRV